MAPGVLETLPEGFEYQSSSLVDNRVKVDPEDARNVTFAVSLESSPYTFMYTVTVSDQEGSYDFIGMITDLRANQPEDQRTIGGDTEVMVVASGYADAHGLQGVFGGHGDARRSGDGDHHRQRVR